MTCCPPHADEHFTKRVDSPLGHFFHPAASPCCLIRHMMSMLPSHQCSECYPGFVCSSTVLDYLLRNMGISQLVMAGCLTDQCVDHAVRDACDKGYLVTLVTGEEVVVAGCLTDQCLDHAVHDACDRGYLLTQSQVRRWW